MIIVGAWVAMCVVLGAAFAIGLLAGGDADPPVAVLQLQGIAIAISFVANVWSFGLLVARAPRRGAGHHLVGRADGEAAPTVLLEPLLHAQGNVSRSWLAQQVFRPCSRSSCFAAASRSSASPWP